MKSRPCLLLFCCRFQSLTELVTDAAVMTSQQGVGFVHPGLVGVRVAAWKLQNYKYGR